MPQLKKELEWQKIIIDITNDFYVNFMNHIGSRYSVPVSVSKYWDQHKSISNVKQIEEFASLLNEVKNEWKTFGSTNETIPVYCQLVMVNAANAINSIVVNLAKSDIIGETISKTQGVDVIASTAMQILATIGTDLNDSYNKFDLKNDPQQIFNQANQGVENILEQPAQEAFSKLIDNEMLFINLFLQLQQKFASVIIQPGSNDEFEGARTQLFTKYINGYIINAMMLTILLVYPFENDLIPENVFNQMKPNLNIF